MGPSKTNRGTSRDAGPSEGKLAWRLPKGYAWDATPVIEDGKIFYRVLELMSLHFAWLKKAGG